jgi:hypothetical protein
MDKIQRYLRIIRLIRSGQAQKLSKDDYTFFSKFSFDVDQDAIEKLQNTAEFKDMSPEQISKAKEDAFLLAVQNPEYREKILTSAEGIENQELTDKITTAINIGLAGADITTSIGQIQAGKRAQDSIARPQAPAPLTADPRLESALSDASRGGELNAARAMSPAQLQILDQYLSDLNTAQTVSGGQAGVYGSLAQVASTRRGRRSAELAPIYDQINREGVQRYDQLLAQKLQENQNIQQSQAQAYPYELQQYGYDQRMAAELGAAGRTNLRSSLGAAGSFAAPVIAKMRTRKRFRDIYNQGLPYGEDNAKTMAEADYKLYNPDSFDSLYQQQMYGAE